MHNSMQLAAQVHALEIEAPSYNVRNTVLQSVQHHLRLEVKNKSILPIRVVKLLQYAGFASAFLHPGGESQIYEMRKLTVQNIKFMKKGKTH